LKKRFLLIAQPNSYRIAPYIKAAINLDLDVLIASEGKHSLITEVHAGLHINLHDLEESLATILKASEKNPFTGVMGSDDSTVELAAMVAEKLRLPHNSPLSAKISRRKDLARAHLASGMCPVPLHCLIDLSQPLGQQIAGLPFPCVIKPLNMSASRGVIRANDKEEFITACKRISAIIADATDEFEQTHVLVEDYIDGIEIAFEGYLHEGKLNPLTIFDKPDPLTGPFFEETIYITPTSLEKPLQEKINHIVQKACIAYGLTTGPVHAELRIDKNQNPWLLEVASRTIGGDCARILDTGKGLNLEALTIALAMGETLPVEDTTELYRGVMMIPIKKQGLLKRTEGILAARKVKHIDSIEIIIPTGHELIPLPEGNQYLGYIFATADTNEAVIDAIRRAYELLDFVINPVFKLTNT